MRGTLPLLLILATALGCQSKKSDAIVAAPTQPMAGAPGAPNQAPGLTGKVLERIAASPYCYLRLQTARGEVWAAVPEAKAEKGSEVTVVNPMLMSNFESKTLNRTFPEIFFGSLAGADQATAEAPAAGTPAPMGAPAPAPVLIDKVDRASGSDAHTVAEIWAQKGPLKDKTVSIRGKVVKYNPSVMGRNWIHLQDGSGDPTKGTHDITVTSQDAVAKGDLVTAKGVVRVDKDFGSGYTYGMLVEDAKIQKK
jgi:hypothetical protein